MNSKIMSELNHIIFNNIVKIIEMKQIKLGYNDSYFSNMGHCCECDKLLNKENYFQIKSYIDEIKKSEYIVLYIHKSCLEKKIFEINCHFELDKKSNNYLKIYKRV